jgi:hypothetical protein
MREGDGGDAAVAVPDEGLRLLRFAGGVPHRAGVFDGARQRLFAGDVLAGFKGGDGHLGVRVVGGGHVNEVDLRIRERFFPVCRGVLPAPAVLELGELLLVAPDDGVHRRLDGEVGKKLGYFEVCVRVGAAHELGAEEADVGRFRGHWRFSCNWI